MIPMLIEEAIKIKMKNKRNPDIISDYELAYACGYASRLMKIEPEEDLEKLREHILKSKTNYTCRDYTEENLFKMIELYSVQNNAPETEHVKQLIKMGKGNWTGDRF
ncbi:MAG: DUF3837 domain-containing protein [Clostridia bacterium]|jgi:DNA-directed RNA polymerase subunit F|nr:DUF3837 domain-containing protein [Clostridia bacterium]